MAKKTQPQTRRGTLVYTTVDAAMLARLEAVGKALGVRQTTVYSAVLHMALEKGLPILEAMAQGYRENGAAARAKLEKGGEGR